MTDVSPTYPPIPADDPKRSLGVARPQTDPALPHVAVAGGVYTILLTGEQTGGRYCLIDMQVPPGGGPPPHRHDFEEMFTVLEGEIVATFRGQDATISMGETINIPANAPHRFKNNSNKPARLLCMCTPPGQEKFFLLVGDPVDTISSPPPQLSDAERANRGARAGQLAAEFRTEFIKP